MRFILFLAFIFGTAYGQVKTYTIDIKDTVQSRGSGVTEYMTIGTDDIMKILIHEPSYIVVNIGLNQLKMYNVTDSSTVIETPSGKIRLKDKLLSYRGKVDGADKSNCHINISKKDVNGFIVVEGEKYDIQSYKGKTIMYANSRFESVFDFLCESRTPYPIEKPRTGGKSVLSPMSKKKVQWYWEVKYEMVLKYGSVDAAANYAKSLFAQMQTLYAYDNITITLKTLYVWDKVDPYTGTNSTTLLDQFCANRPTWDGDLAHLLGTTGSGGQAYVNGIIYCAYGMDKVCAQKGYSGNLSAFNTLPAYSFSLYMVAHEHGHQIGSQHTHDCVWPSVPGCNMCRIDACGNKIGYKTGLCAVPNDSLPIGKGTIMSYCPQAGVGIDFTLGFGPLPKERIHASLIQASPCLTDSGGVYCPVPVMSSGFSYQNNITVGSNTTIKANPITGATTYKWTFPTGWICNTGCNTNSINAKVGSSGKISVVAFNSCGEGAVASFNITTVGIVTPPPPPPCIPKKYTRTVSCPVGYTGSILQVRDSSCTTGLGEWRDSIKNCTTVITTCSYKLPGNDTTYYRIVDTIVKSGIPKKDSLGNYVPYFIKVYWGCVTCCWCQNLNSVIKWKRNGIDMPSWTGKQFIFFWDGYKYFYKKGDIISVTITNSTRTLAKTCVNSKTISYTIP